MASSPTPEFPPLDLPEYKRYGRQMILDGFGLEGAHAHSQNPDLPAHPVRS